LLDNLASTVADFHSRRLRKKKRPASRAYSVLHAAPTLVKCGTVDWRLRTPIHILPGINWTLFTHVTGSVRFWCQGRSAHPIYHRYKMPLQWKRALLVATRWHFLHHHSPQFKEWQLMQLPVKQVKGYQSFSPHGPLSLHALVLWHWSKFILGRSNLSLGNLDYKGFQPDSVGASEVVNNSHAVQLASARKALTLMLLADASTGCVWHVGNVGIVGGS
jgi:hypothetical protein